jgi:hypothetical protein
MVASPFLMILSAGDETLPDIVKLALFAGACAAALAAAFIAIDVFDARWRAGSLKAAPAMTVEQLLKAYAQVIENHYPEGPARNGRLATVAALGSRTADGFDQLTNAELALLEDAVLLPVEYRGGIANYAYGIHFMLGLAIFSFFLGFGAAYSFMMPYIRDMLGPNYAERGFFLMAAPLALGLAYLAFRDSAGLWLRLGTWGRNMVRLMIYYWPITFVFAVGAADKIKSMKPAFL